ncbi:MAG: 1,4-dihydroxy-2-naphthoate octaprenyltransferase [Deltaproteobacteria bacterium CG11_big_fil_rev_8_21_14_0_20_49_13]|nr:MAG: 1,4-dihydroxy-2-naphthoate octaprenyltransferase [Deltaproteobacteria bacterium CG11_big_fil_rev_8_21_14_0_20_49_13]
MEKIKIYWRAARPFSFTVSIVPPILAAVIAMYENPLMHIKWFYLILTILGCWLAHAGANIFSDYFDFKNRVDREGRYGSSGVLVEGLLTPKENFLAALVCFIVASAIGLFFILTLAHGSDLVWLIALGAFLGFFYTVNPFILKYRALGDIAVFLAFGPAMCLGAFFVQAGHFAWAPALYAIPVALLVDAVLHSNNLRDIKNDSVVKIRTVPIMIGEENAKRMYYALLIGAYVMIPILIIFANLTWISLLTFASIPSAVKLIKAVKNKSGTPEAEFADIDARTAQFHSAFSILFIISILISIWSG